MSNDQQEVLVLIDGHALAYRMFFALPEVAFSTQDGESTNAVFGFTRRVMELMQDTDPPDYLAVSFDAGLTGRDEIYPEYKGTREKMPDSLRQQIVRIKEVLEALNIPIMELEGYEADDVLGTVARKAGEEGLGVIIVTGDRDLLQLVNDYTLIELPTNRSNEYAAFDAEAVVAKYGVHPERYVDFKAITGDPSDNIPGVKGVGDKTAAKLLQQYESLDEVYEHLDDIAEESGTKRFTNALDRERENAYLSLELSRIRTDLDVPFDREACRTRDFDQSVVLAKFQELNFRSLADRLVKGPDLPTRQGAQLSLFDDPESPPDELPTASTETITVQDEVGLEAMVKRLNEATAIAFDVETDSLSKISSALVGISLAVEAGEGYYIPVGHTETDEPQLPLEMVIEALREPMTNPAIPKAAHNMKFDFMLLDRYGLTVHPLSFDTMIGEFLLRPGSSRSQLGLKGLAFSRLQEQMTEIKELLGTGRKQITMDRVAIERAAPYAAADADMTLRLYEQIKPELEEAELEELFYELEMPLIPILSAMERRGMLLAPELLQQMSAEATAQLEELTQQIQEIAGTEFNINSPEQLSGVLFDQLGLPTQGIPKTKKGFHSTAAAHLERLQQVDETGMLDAIMSYRELEKLRSTYLDNLPTLVNESTGRIHSSFNQTGAVTGRLSSSDPNLQNIPIRTDLGRRVRDAFIAGPGHQLIAADYSQVELRILAHVSGDEGMLNAFRENQDIHTITAATVYDVTADDVTREQRSFAKSVNFGLMYGMGAFRLAQSSGLSQAEAKEFIETYFQRFPEVKRYLDETRLRVVEQGYVETLLGRRRYFPIFSDERASRQDLARAEREAINMPIQGTAADIIKIAMIRLYDALHERGLRAEMVLQVHDELVLEVPNEEVDEVAELVRTTMEEAFPMDIPLRVDVNIGTNWGQMK